MPLPWWWWIVILRREIGWDIIWPWRLGRWQRWCIPGQGRTGLVFLGFQVLDLLLRFE
jgi:hypothetical protein